MNRRHAQGGTVGPRELIALSLVCGSLWLFFTMLVSGRPLASLLCMSVGFTLSAMVLFKPQAK